MYVGLWPPAGWVTGDIADHSDVMLGQLMGDAPALSSLFVPPVNPDTKVKKSRILMLFRLSLLFGRFHSSIRWVDKNGLRRQK